MLAALVEGFGLFALARVVSGLGFLFATLYFTKMVADWFAGRELATAMSVLVMSWPLGIALVQVTQPWLAAQFGWRSVFHAASLYGVLGALAVFALYRPGGTMPKAGAAPRMVWTLSRREWMLTLVAAVAWGLFNGGYIVYLSFAPRALEPTGMGARQAMLIVSLASWVMLFSGAIAGQVADRTGRRDLVIHVGMAVAALSLVLWTQPGWALPLSLMFGLFGAAPAGVIMSLTGEAMSPDRRAFGMGVFLSLYFVLVTLAPPAAGWLFDRTGDESVPLAFGATLFAATSVATWVFRRVHRSGSGVAKAGPH